MCIWRIFQFGWPLVHSYLENLGPYYSAWSPIQISRYSISRFLTYKNDEKFESYAHFGRPWPENLNNQEKTNFFQISYREYTSDTAAGFPWGRLRAYDGTPLEPSVFHFILGMQLCCKHIKVFHCYGNSMAFSSF